MKHTRPFVDPLRPRLKGLSDTARDNYDRIFGERPLPNEKDHLESYVRIGDERILVGSANTPIAKKEKPKPISVPGEVHRIDLNEIPPGVSLKDLFERAIAESES